MYKKYNGVVLPELPVVDGFPSCYIRKSGTSGYYDLIFADCEFVYSTNGIYTWKNGALNNNVTEKWYRLSINNPEKEWLFYKDTVGYFVIDSNRTAIWTSTDIHNGSTTGSIYLAGSEPVNTIIRSFCRQEVVSSALSGSFSVEAEIDDTLLLCVVHRSTLEIPEGFNLIYSDSYGVGSNQIMAFYSKKVTQSGTQNITYVASASNSMYRSCWVLKGVKQVKRTGNLDFSKTCIINDTGIDVVKPSADSIVLWAIHCNYALNAISTTNDYAITPNDCISCNSGKAGENTVRLATFLDDTNVINHTINYPMTGSYQFGVDGLEIILENGSETKYLIKHNNEIYTVKENQLSLIGETELTSSVFLNHGFDDISKTAVEIIKGLGNCSVCSWTDGEKPVPLKASVQAIPHAQNIIGDVDISHHSIKGILSAVADVSMTVRMFISSDKQEWQVFRGGAWIADNDGMSAEELQAITEEQWNAYIEDKNHIYLKAVLSDAEQQVKSIKLNFRN